MGISHDECTTLKLSEYDRQMQVSQCRTRGGGGGGGGYLSPRHFSNLFDFQVSWGRCKTLSSLPPLCFGSVSASTNWMERGDGPRWITAYLGAIGITENQASLLVKIAPAWNFQCSNGTAVFIISYFLTCARYDNAISMKPVVMLGDYWR